jgi:hypothetical protein
MACRNSSKAVLSSWRLVAGYLMMQRGGGGISTRAACWPKHNTSKLLDFRAADKHFRSDVEFL